MSGGARAELGLSAALGALLVASTLGEGGATPTATVWVHGGVVVILGALLIVPARWGETSGRVPRAAWGAALVFIALTMIGAVLAPYRYAALARLLEIGTFLGIVLIAARCGPQLWRRVSLPVLIAAALQGALALQQRLADGAARPAGTFLNPNHLAIWLVAALFIGAGSAPRAGSIVPIVLRAALAAPTIAAIYLTGSRGAVLGLGAGAAWLTATTWPRLDRRARAFLSTAMAVVVAIVGVGVAVRTNSFDPYRYQRLRIWEASLAVALDHPWGGVGPGQWDAAANNVSFPVETGPLRYERIVDSTHSDLLRLPAELGWPTAVAALAALVLAIRAVRRGRREGRLDATSVGAVAALVALGVQSLVDNPSSRLALVLLAAALLGSLTSEPRRLEARSGMGLRYAALGVLVTAFAVGDASPYLAWSLQRGLPRGRLDDVQREALKTALSRNPLHPDLWLRRAQDIAGDGRDWGNMAYARAREAAETAVRLQPADARYRVGLARIEGLAFGTLFGDAASRERVAQIYRRAQARARHDPGIAVEEGEFLLRAADPAGARRAAERALAIEPNGVPARLLLAETLLASEIADGPARAAALVDEAEAIARRWSDRPRISAYSRFHLGIDSTRVVEIRGRIEATAGKRPQGSS